MRISYCSSDVFSSDLQFGGLAADAVGRAWMDRGRVHLAHFDGSSRGIRGRGLHDDVADGTDTLVSVVAEQLVGRLAFVQELGSGSCRERVWQKVEISVFAVSLTNKKTNQIPTK